MFALSFSNQTFFVGDLFHALITNGRAEFCFQSNLFSVNFLMSSAATPPLVSSSWKQLSFIVLHCIGLSKFFESDLYFAQRWSRKLMTFTFCLECCLAMTYQIRESSLLLRMTPQFPYWFESNSFCHHHQSTHIRSNMKDFLAKFICINFQGFSSELCFWTQGFWHWRAPRISYFLL